MSVMMFPITEIQSVSETPSGRIAIMAVVPGNAITQADGSEEVSAVDLEMDKEQAKKLLDGLGEVLKSRT